MQRAEAVRGEGNSLVDTTSAPNEKRDMVWMPNQQFWANGDAFAFVF